MKKIDKKHLLGVLLVMILTAGISLEIGSISREQISTPAKIAELVGEATA